MKKQVKLTLGILAPLAAFFFAAAMPALAGNDDDSDDKEVIPFDVADIFFEENTTDEDLGLHFKLDGDEWKRIMLISPKRKVLVDTSVKGNLGKEIGLTELFAESAEPGYDEMPRQEFLDLFPPGIYTFLGVTLEGDWLYRTAVLSHRIPAGAVLVTPPEAAVVDSTLPLTVTWLPVSDPNPPHSVIAFYEVIVEKDHEDELLRVFSVIMLPGETTVTCPAEFLEPGKDYKVEIISEETSGNRSSIEVPFSTLP